MKVRVLVKEYVELDVNIESNWGKNTDEFLDDLDDYLKTSKKIKEEIRDKLILDDFDWEVEWKR